MTGEEWLQKAEAEDAFVLIQSGKTQQQPIQGPYCCDLLSLAMVRAPRGCIWVTVIANLNTLAVASLVHAVCVILAEGVQLDAAARKKAEEEKIWVFSTKLPVFEAALAARKLCSEQNENRAE